MLKRKLVGLATASAMTGAAVPTLRRWLRLRRLRYYRVGGRVMLDEADIERFLDAGRVEARETR
jgi:excisionase family DNA binding protein